MHFGPKVLDKLSPSTSSCDHFPVGPVPRESEPEYEPSRKRTFSKAMRSTHTSTELDGQLDSDFELIVCGSTIFLILYRNFVPIDDIQNELVGEILIVFFEALVVCSSILGD